MTTLDQLFADKGFTKGGGIWGEQQWKRLGPKTIVAVGGAYGPTDTDGDFLQVPVKANWPCKVCVWQGDACIGWEDSDGHLEAPFMPGEGLYVDQVCDNVADALEFVGLVQVTKDE